MALPGLLLVLCGPSGVGKSTLVAWLKATEPDLRFSVSFTTRAPRPGDVEGQSYHFVDDESFLAKVARDEMLEHAEVFGRRYGTERLQVDGLVERGSVVLLDIDVQGAAQVRARAPDAVFVFILPPSMEVLEARLRGRNSDAPEVIERRLAVARSEVREAPWFDYVLVNDDLSTVQAHLGAILRAERIRRDKVRALAHVRGA